MQRSARASEESGRGLPSEGEGGGAGDARNELREIRVNGTVTARFMYDPFGRRIKKAVNGRVRQYLYDGFNPVQELNGANPPAVTANLLTGLNIDEYFGRIDASGAMSFLADAPGSTIALTDTAGAIQTQYTYEPFGNVTVSGTANANPYQFTGRENDGTGLYFYRARYYSPTFQRFVSQDPIGFAGGINSYAYVGDDPVDFGDPTGYCANHPQNPGCGAALGELGLGLLGTALTIGPVVAAPYLAPELFVFEGVGGVLDAMHVAAGAGLVAFPSLYLLEQGGVGVVQNYF